MRRSLVAIAATVALSVLFIPWGRAGQEGKMRSDTPVVLGTPEQVEHFMQLDMPVAFSHEAMFLSDESGVQGILDLKLTDALTLGIKNNLTSKLASEKVEQALGRKWQAMSGLLPQLNGSVMEQRTFKENLEAKGMKGSGYIGPFNTFDARLQLVQQVINVSALSNFQAGVRGVNAARHEKEFARQKVVLLVSLDYLEALRAQAAFQAAEANMGLSQKLLKRSEHQFQAGLASRVDVARASTRLAQDELRMAGARTGVHDAYLDLQRSMGLAYDRVVKLMNALTFIREAVPVLTSAMASAEKDRLDMRIARERVEEGVYRARSVKTQLLPRLEFIGDYGSTGNEWDKNDKNTSRAMLRASMPLFEGGKILGEIKEANSYRRQAELYADDLKRQIEEDVQRSIWALDTSMEQVSAAGHVVGLAEHELALASDRFSQGVGDNIEVLHAQTALADARDQYVAALTRYHTARINLYFSLGKTDAFYLQDAGQTKGQ